MYKIIEDGWSRDFDVVQTQDEIALMHKRSVTKKYILSEWKRLTEEMKAHYEVQQHLHGNDPICEELSLDHMEEPDDYLEMVEEEASRTRENSERV